MLREWPKLCYKIQWGSTHLLIMGNNGRNLVIKNLLMDRDEIHLRLIISSKGRRWFYLVVINVKSNPIQLEPLLLLSVSDDAVGRLSRWLWRFCRPIKKVCPHYHHYHYHYHYYHHQSIIQSMNQQYLVSNTTHFEPLNHFGPSYRMTNWLAIEFIGLNFWLI